MYTVSASSTAPRYFFTPALVSFCLLFLVGCTSIGPTDPAQEAATKDMGPETYIRVCLFKDENVSGSQARKIQEAIEREFAQYGLAVTFVRTTPWQRDGFLYKDILQEIAGTPLSEPCDRNLTLVSRNVFDFVWGMFMPEVFGAVESATHTKGYVVAEVGSLGQLMSFQSPEEIAIHEFYHLLGIAHGDGALIIRKKILSLKQSAIKNRQRGTDFFPGIGKEGLYYLNRHAVNKRHYTLLNIARSTGKFEARGYHR